MPRHPLGCSINAHQEFHRQLTTRDARDDQREPKEAGFPLNTDHETKIRCLIQTHHFTLKYHGYAYECEGAMPPDLDVQESVSTMAKAVVRPIRSVVPTSDTVTLREPS